MGRCSYCHYILRKHVAFYPGIESFLKIKNEERLGKVFSVGGPISNFQKFRNAIDRPEFQKRCPNELISANSLGHRKMIKGQA